VTSGPHGHRPSLADQRAVLAAARAVLAADPDAAHQAAESGSCAACTVVAALQLGFALAASLTTGEPFTAYGSQLHARLLAAVSTAQAELRAAQN
jgi:hypothetical protein